MFTSINDPLTETDEQLPHSSPPWVWVGFLFAFAFFVIEVLFVALDLEERGVNLILMFVLIGGWIYWLVCIHRIHKILAELTRNKYPISPGEAAGYHFIPFYNLVWIFKWPIELSGYLNRRGRVKMISGGLIGALLLVALLLRFLDGSLGMLCMFAVLVYVSAKVKQHVKALRGITPDQLPPLPDPAIFSRPQT
jgi:hypothetical protein